MRRVYLKLTVALQLDIDEGVEVQQVVNDLDYDFSTGGDTATQADVREMEITDHEVVDSK